MAARDKWSEWLLHRRFGGNAEAQQRAMRMLYEVRDRILDRARVREGATLLDVGAGDGLVAFAALDRVGAHGRVIFSDISQPLLDRARKLTEEIGASDRCSFLNIPADRLDGVADASVDVVTTRSVLIYVKDKAAAFGEFHRVLKPGGRVSSWEPINRFNATYAPMSNWGGGIPGIEGLAERLRDFFLALQPLDSDPMLDFDERDLLRHCESAGFRDVRVDLRISASLSKPASWDVAMNTAGNPNIPSMGEAMRRIFTDDERERFEAAMRPRIEGGGQVERSATVHLLAVKDRGAGEGELPAIR